MSRRLKFVLGLLGLQATAMLVVLGVTYWASQELLLRYSESFAARVSRDATAYTEAYLDPAADTVEVAHRLVERELFGTQQTSDLKRFFLELLRVHETLDGIFLGLESGQFLYASRAAEGAPGALRVKRVETQPERRVSYEWYSDRLRQQGQEMDPSDTFDPRTRPWYQAALAQDGTVWTAPYVFFTSGEPGITVAVPVHNTLGSGIVGAIGADIKIAALSGFLETLDISPRGQAAIVAESGEVVAHSLPEMTGGARFQNVADGGDPILAQAVGQIEGGLASLFPGEIRLTRFEAGDEVWIGSVLRLELARTPWTVVTYLPERDILEPLHQVRDIAILVSLIALVGVGAVGLLFGQRIMNRTEPR